MEPCHAVSATDTYNNLHIAIASLRNGWDIIMRELPDWLSCTVRFCDEPWDDAYVFWTCLQVEPRWVEELVDLQLHFSNGHLKLRRSLQHDNDWVDRVSCVLMVLWRFKNFTATRWLTIGDSCRTLLRGFASGIHDLVRRCLANPKNSKYYLGGWSRMDKQLCKFVITAGLVAYPPDAFLLESFEDDRIALRLDAIRGSVFQELEYLSNLDKSIWVRFASFADTSPGPLRHAVISGALRAVAFMDWRVFQEAESLPWRLVRGDIASNLQALKASNHPADLVSRKIRYLLEGCSIGELLEPVALLGETSWSIRIAEQGHAAATRLQRQHPEYESNTLTVRSSLASMSPLFALEPEEKALARAEAKLQSLRRKNPRKIGGKSCYVKALIDESQSLKNEANLWHVMCHRKLWLVQVLCGERWIMIGRHLSKSRRSCCKHRDRRSLTTQSSKLRGGSRELAVVLRI
jgi:hypothetical protein